VRKLVQGGSHVGRDEASAVAVPNVGGEEAVEESVEVETFDD
jgi:hypothetical protein